jgi:hypothetical protein
MANDQRQSIRTLRRGFGDLEAIGLLARERQRKPHSKEWAVTIYHPRLTSLPEQGHRAKPTGGDRPQNYPRDSEFRVEKGSKGPLDGETPDAEELAKKHRLDGSESLEAKLDAFDRFIDRVYEGPTDDR